jgi:WD40 repeat protein
MGAHFLQTLTVIANTRCPLRRTSSGNLIFSTIRNQAVIWDAYNDKLIRQLTCHQNDISEIIELGKNETIFVTSSDDGSIKICHLERQVIVREDHHEPVLGLARLGFDIFASYSNHKILIWSYKNNVLTLRQEISSKANIEQIIAIRNDQFIIIDESKNPSLFTRAGSEFAKSDFLLPFTSLIYLPSIGALLGKSNIDNSYCSLKIGEIMESTPIPKLSDHLNGKTIHFLDSGNMDLVAVVDTSDLLVWKEADFDSDPIVISAKYTCTIAAIDEAQLAAMDKYGKIRLLNTHEHLIHSSPALDSVISALEVIDNGNIVALDGSGSIALLKRLSSGIECRALRKEDTLNSSSDLTRIGECSIATTCNDRSIRIWTCTSNEVLDAGKLCFHQSDYTNSHRSPIFLIVLGTSCLIAADDNQIIGWPIDIKNNSIKFNGNPTGTILFNSENNRISSLFALVEAGSHAQHYLLALEKPKDDNHFLHTFSISLMHKSQARQIKFEHNPSFYPDFDPLRTSVSLKNGTLATAANNNNIYVWRVVNYNSCESINTLVGHTDNIRDMISIDDFRILSCSDDRTILMWTFSKSEVNSRVVFVADGRITSLGFNDKHQFFVAGDEFGNVHILDL